MYADTTVGVVVPAYNEAAFIGDVIRAIPAYVDRIYVVDDASTDDTWEEILAASPASGDRSQAEERTDGRTASAPSESGPATDVTDSHQSAATAEFTREWDLDLLAGSEDGVPRTLAARSDTIVGRGRVVAIRHRENQGAGGAILTGYLAALVDGVDAIATIDGDGQMDPTTVATLLDPIVEGQAGYAKGNRLLHPEYRSEMPRFRLVGNAILTFLTKIASGYWRVMDPQNGYTVISRDALEAVGPEKMYEGYGYCNDLLIRLNVAETTIADVPTDVNYADEESHIRYSSYIPRVSMLLLEGFLWRLRRKYCIRDFHPLVFFYTSGAAITGVGLLGALSSLLGGVLTGANVALAGAVSILLLVMGWLFLLLAMVFDCQLNRSLVRPQQFDVTD